MSTSIFCPKKWGLIRQGYAHTNFAYLFFSHLKCHAYPDTAKRTITDATNIEHYRCGTMVVRFLFLMLTIPWQNVQPCKLKMTASRSGEKISLVI
jgi:hypothetical protein